MQIERAQRGQFAHLRADHLAERDHDDHLRLELADDRDRFRPVDLLDLQHAQPCRRRRLRQRRVTQVPASPRRPGRLSHERSNIMPRRQNRLERGYTKIAATA